mmetsp:Transcript_19014/g.55189  ORF Transcript_19014/g.55189 Transcript_19014/m.55189 type:complete len:312 (+) Transcript_19014:1103-2038(+)
MSTTCGTVSKATSAAMCEIERPGIRTKHHCMPEDAAWVAKFPTMLANTLHTVSCPRVCSIRGKSDSTLAGTPITRVGTCCSAKYSAMCAVHEWTFLPPQITRPSSSSFLAVAAHGPRLSVMWSRSSGWLWPSRSHPPWFLWGRSISSVSSKVWPPTSPAMPMAKQTIVPSIASRKSCKPWITLFKPGPARPTTATPTRRLARLRSKAMSSPRSEASGSELGAASELRLGTEAAPQESMRGMGPWRLGRSGSICSTLTSSETGWMTTAFRLSVRPRAGKAAKTRPGSAQTRPLWSSSDILKRPRSTCGKAGR